MYHVIKGSSHEVEPPVSSHFTRWLKEVLLQRIFIRAAFSVSLCYILFNGFFILRNYIVHAKQRDAVDFCPCSYTLYLLRSRRDCHS